MQRGSRSTLVVVASLGLSGFLLQAQAQETNPSPVGVQASSPELIERGKQLFTEETFGGNGRTCATCHPPTHNFTLDSAYIRRLPSTDPLFVAEFNPALKDLEEPRLLRRFALIAENLDGFSQPAVMRSVPPTLGLSRSIQSDQGTATRPAFPLANATGWSGDGAPGSGSLREFAIGAVIQHMPKSLNRQEGIDFRLPTDDELDALLAYQLSLGRQEEVNIRPDDPNALRFADAVVEQGKLLFHGAPARDGGTRACSGCHSNAGANDSAGNNRNFATGVNRATNAPSCLLPRVAVAGDGGFAADPLTTIDKIDLCGGSTAGDVPFRGDMAFNTVSLIEAADTPPYFHNNIAATLEEAIDFYTSDTFNGSIAGNGRAFVLTSDDVNAISALLRALNILENIRSSNAYDQQVIDQPLSSVAETIALALKETQDAIDVLTDSPVPIYSDTQVLSLLRRARALQVIALTSPSPSRELLKAIQFKTEARQLMLL